MKKLAFNREIQTPNGVGILIGISKVPTSLDLSVNLDGEIETYFVSHKVSDLSDEQRRRVGWRGSSCVNVSYPADQIEPLNFK